MLRTKCAVSLVVALGICIPVWAAPLNPVNPRIDTGVTGHAGLNGPFPSVPVASYNQSGHSDSFSGAGAHLDGGVHAGEIPGIPHAAGAASSAGATFQQIAPNEYVLELSTTANGTVDNREPATFGRGWADSDGHVSVISQFQVLGLPGQTPGAPSTILLTLEHNGALHLLNSGNASSEAQVHVTGDTSFHYSDNLSTPGLQTGMFDEFEYWGRRNRTVFGTATTHVGAMFTVNASLTSRMVADLDVARPYDHVAADSLFGAGLRLHMTVLPEPASALLLLAGAGVVLRRRRTHA